MEVSLKGKKALVCGSTQGIGKAIAISLADAGAEVILLARNKEKLDSTLKGLNHRFEQQHEYLVADFSDPDQLTHISELIQKLGPIHILVNNTGGPTPGPVVDALTKDFYDAFSKHLICNQILTQHVVGGMKAEKYGRIINIISTSVKEPIPGLGVSNTIRASVAGWSKTLSMELAPFGITVNNILPGYTKTSRLEAIIQQKATNSGKSKEEIEQEMLKEIPAGRFANPLETAALAVFLASPLASYINGTNIPVDGGRTRTF